MHLSNQRDARREGEKTDDDLCDVILSLLPFNFKILYGIIYIYIIKIILIVFERIHIRNILHTPLKVSPINPTCTTILEIQDDAICSFVHKEITPVLTMSMMWISSSITYYTYIYV